MTPPFALSDIQAHHRADLLVEDQEVRHQEEDLLQEVSEYSF